MLVLSSQIHSECVFFISHLENLIWIPVIITLQVLNWNMYKNKPAQTGVTKMKASFLVKFIYIVISYGYIYIYIYTCVCDQKNHICLL